MTEPLIPIWIDRFLKFWGLISREAVPHLKLQCRRTCTILACQNCEYQTYLYAFYRVLWIFRLWQSQGNICCRIGIGVEMFFRLLSTIVLIMSHSTNLMLIQTFWLNEAGAQFCLNSKSAGWNLPCQSSEPVVSPSILSIAKISQSWSKGVIFYSAWHVSLLVPTPRSSEISSQ